MTKKIKSNSEAANQQYSELGKMLVAVYETGYLDIRKSYKQNFIKGLVSGAGGVIGATVVITILLWFLSLFKQVPLVGPLTNSIRHSVEEKR